MRPRKKNERLRAKVKDGELKGQRVTLLVGHLPKSGDVPVRTGNGFLTTVKASKLELIAGEKGAKLSYD